MGCYYWKGMGETMLMDRISLLGRAFRGVFGWLWRGAEPLDQRERKYS
jgi:hypothetical protein